MLEGDKITYAVHHAAIKQQTCPDVNWTQRYEITG